MLYFIICISAVVESKQAHLLKYSSTLTDIYSRCDNNFTHVYKVWWTLKGAILHNKYLCFWYFKYILLVILLYFYVRIVLKTNMMKLSIKTNQIFAVSTSFSPEVSLVSSRLPRNVCPKQIPDQWRCRKVARLTNVTKDGRVVLIITFKRVMV